MTTEFEKAIASAREARRVGRASDAIRDYKRASSLAREESLNELLAFALRHLGDLQQETGDFIQADQAIVEAVAIYRALNEGNPLNLANALRLHALAQEALGGTNLAIKSWKEAHSLYLKTGINEGVQESQSHLNTLRRVS